VRIGELSNATGVSRRLLRYYEEQGLLTPERTEKDYRVYGLDAPIIVAQVRALLKAGLSTDVIRTLLPCARGSGPSFVPCPDLLDALRRELMDLDARILALVEARGLLHRYVAETDEVAECSAPAAASA
jgi:DNA-binding transcriptional MerR regulator